MNKKIFLLGALALSTAGVVSCKGNGSTDKNSITFTGKNTILLGSPDEKTVTLPFSLENELKEGETLAEPTTPSIKLHDVQIDSGNCEVVFDKDNKKAIGYKLAFDNPQKDSYMIADLKFTFINSNKKEICSTTIKNFTIYWGWEPENTIEYTGAEEWGYNWKNEKFELPFVLGKIPENQAFDFQYKVLEKQNLEDITYTGYGGSGANINAVMEAKGLPGKGEHAEAYVVFSASMVKTDGQGQPTKEIVCSTYGSFFVYWDIMS